MPRVRIRMHKLGRYAYLSHLDMVRVLERAIRRAGLRLAYSQGFNPHPKISFGAPLAVGVTSTCEVADVEFDGSVSPDEIINKLNEQLPEGMKVDKAVLIDRRAKSLMSEIAAARYIIRMTLAGPELGQLEDSIKQLLDRDQLLLEKTRDGDVKVVDVRPYILDMKAMAGETLQIEACLCTGSKGNLRPDDLVTVMRQYGVLPPETIGVRIHRIELLVERDGRLVSAI